MQSDPTEGMRRAMVEAINRDPDVRSDLESEYGKVWNTEELQEDFSVEGFAAPFVVVTRKSDGVRGSLMFQHYPRFYFAFTEDKP